MSHPTRVRGLKPCPVRHPHGRPDVAPHAGAWIETDSSYSSARQAVVAPHAGAWIETGHQSYSLDGMTSHPTRVRGLKLH